MAGRSTALITALCCTWLVATLLSSPSAQANEQPTAQKKRARVTVFYLFPDGFPARDAARLTRQFNRALRENKRLAVRDYDKLLAEYAGDVPTAQVSAAEDGLRQAVKLLTDGSSKEAASRLNEVIPKLEGVLAFIKKRRIEEAYLALGIAQAMEGHRRQARRTFTNLLIWRPRARYNLDIFPAKFVGLFEKTRKRVKRLARGSVVVKTEPKGAKAYVDGRFVGVTPADAYGLTIGKHYVTVKKAGYIKAGLPVEVSPTEQKSYSLELKRSDKYLLLEQGIAQARQGLGKDEANAAMLDLRSVLFIDQAIFAEVSVTGSSWTINTHLYDLRSKLRLNKATITVEHDQVAKLKDLAQLLYVNVRYDGVVEAPPDPPPPPPKMRKAFYTRWWFWTAIAAGTAAVVIPIVALSGGDEGCPEGNRCIGISN